MSTNPPDYDWKGEAYRLAPGLVATRELDDAFYGAWEANGYAPWTPQTVLAVTGPLPAPLTTIPRLPPEFMT